MLWEQVVGWTVLAVIVIMLATKSSLGVADGSVWDNAAVLSVFASVALGL